MVAAQPEAGPDTQALFAVPSAANVQERRPRTLKQGETFGVFDESGNALPEGGSAEGLYHCDTRHLSQFVLMLGDQRPVLLSSSMSNDNGTLTFDLCNPDLAESGTEGAVAHDLIHLRRSRFLWQGVCFERIAIRNYDDCARRLRLSVVFGADFADLFEVRGTARTRHGQMQPPSIGIDRVTLAYSGLDGTHRQTRFRFEPAPSRLAAVGAEFNVRIAPGASTALYVEIACTPAIAPAIDAVLPHRAFFTALAASRRALRRTASRAASVATSNALFNEAARRAVADLAMLTTETAQGSYPYAGIPWFSTVFGRDGLITALQTLWLDPAIALGVLRHLAANQATAYDDAADAEPGKILHEVRHGEMAILGEVPFRRYYGSVDSTPLFVMLAGAYLRRTGDLAAVEALWPNIERALSWIDTDGDADGDGFVEYGRKSGLGLVNQGWKDSHDSIFHADGTMAAGPIALIEVQAYVYGAWNAAAEIARQLGQAARAQALEGRARVLQARFDVCFFDAALGTYVLALDGAKAPCRVRTSNAGHALLTGIAYPERAAAVVASLMDGASFSGWGVRTVASTEARYNPMSYHNGSVWPHDNALIAAGFARYGFSDEAARIFEGLFAASTYIDQRRLPELFCGFSRQRSRGPTFYPVACSPQAWAAVAPLSLVQSSLGLSFDPASCTVALTRPALPPFLDEVILRNLAVGGGSADIVVRREFSAVVVDIMRRSGGMKVTATA